MALAQSDAMTSRRYRIFAAAGLVSRVGSSGGFLFAEIDSLGSSFGVGNRQRNVATGSITTIQRHGPQNGRTWKFFAGGRGHPTTIGSPNLNDAQSLVFTR